MVKLENGDLARTTIGVWRDALNNSLRAGADFKEAVDNADLAVAHFRVRFSEDLPVIAQERSLAVAMQNESGPGLRVCLTTTPSHPIGTVREVSEASAHQSNDLVLVEWDNKQDGEDWVPIESLRCVKNTKFDLDDPI